MKEGNTSPTVHFHFLNQGINTSLYIKNSDIYAQKSSMANTVQCPFTNFVKNQLEILTNLHKLDIFKNTLI